jgi:hypothetical protein
MTQNKLLPREIEVSLLREASMSSMAIGIGLTHIRQYHFTHTGFFYSGLLSFTSGIERLLKLILIYDYRLNNADAFPQNSYLKTLGHKLDDLIKKAREINTTQGTQVNDSFFDNDVLYQSLTSFLTDFAVQARYYNLDYLTGKQQGGIEPLARWDKEICTEMLKRHYKPKPKMLEMKKRLADELENFTSVIHINEDGSAINTVSDLAVKGDLIPTKQKYSMFYLYTVARFLSELCSELEYKGNFYPYLREFFVLFRIEDNRYVLNRKRWLPNSL